MDNEVRFFSEPPMAEAEIQAYLAIAKGYLQQGDRAAALRVLARANVLAEGTPLADTVRSLRMQLVDTTADDNLPPSPPAAAPSTTGSPPPTDSGATAPHAPVPASP